MRSFALVVMTLVVVGCASMMATAGSGLAGNLNIAIMNQDDPELVRDGAPAYLLMLDSFVQGAPENGAVLSAAAELYSAYGVVFVDDPIRSRKLTTRGRSYGQRALCAANERACGIWDMTYDDFVFTLQFLRKKDAAALYTFGLSWIAYIQAHSDDWAALARLPQAQATLLRVQEIDPHYQQANVEHFLAVLNTIRPPALGGDFVAGLEHYQRAMSLDRLLNEVLSADPVQPGYTLFNTIAQDDAQVLLDSADDYF